MLLVPWGRVLRRALVLTAVVVATLAGAYGALATVQTESTLSVGTVRFDVDPGHRGALDIYAPLVDWGVRFRGVRLPVRLKVDVRSVDRDAVVRVAQAGNLDVAAVREEATDAVRNFLIVLLVATLVVGFALGALVALAARPYSPLRLRVTLPVAGGTALLATLLVAFLLPPSLSTNPKPQYYANGPDIPRALQALQTLRLSATRLDDELDTQLVGLARLVSDPASRQPLDGLPRLTVASDLHTNVLAIPALERAVNRGPLFFVGDLSDSGSPLEADLIGRIAHAGRPFVYVAGNHDSDTLDRRLANAGAVVLTRRGRLRADGSYGPVVVKEAGLRVAGYDDPLERRSDEGYRDHGGTPSVQQQAAFQTWFHTVRDKVDAIMVHNPAVAQLAFDELRADPPTTTPLVFFVGHTHHARLDRIGSVTVINGGTVGGGGAANVEDGSPIGIAAMTYRRDPDFSPLAVDLVQIDPGTGSATANRTRLDTEPTEDESDDDGSS
jgi:predicted phosphodiesterase